MHLEGSPLFSNIEEGPASKVKNPSRQEESQENKSREEKFPRRQVLKYESEGLFKVY